MKIAIYGDSFGILNSIHENRSESNVVGTCWPELLASSHAVDNYARSGTAFMYSYEQYLKHNADYDANIFVITNPQRTYIKALDGILVFGVYWIGEELTRLSKVPWYENKNDHIEILKSVEVYLDKWKDWEMDTHIQHVLVSNLWSINPNTLVIPAFSDSMKETNKNLFDLAKYELKLVDEHRFNKFDFNWLVCLRKCHFSEENNHVIYDAIVKALENNEKIVTLDFEDIKKPAKSFDYYVSNNKPTFDSK